MGQLPSSADASCGRITLTERLLARRTTAEHHVARKQTFVLPALPIRLQRILLPRSTLGFSRVGRWFLLGFGDRIRASPIIEGAQPVLEVPQPIRTQAWQLRRAP